MKHLARAYFVFGVLLAAIAVVQIFRWARFPFHPAAYLIPLAPAGAFLIAYASTRKLTRKSIHALTLFMCMAVLAFAAVATIFLEGLVQATTPVTDVKQYESILQDYWDFDRDLVSHFPRPIPADAADVHFSFLRGFLQGGAHIQLRLSLSQSRVSTEYERFMARSTRSFTGGDTNDHMNMKDGLPTTFYHTGDTKGQFPQDFVLLSLDTSPSVETGSQRPNWNHGRSHGVAISRQRNQVVYWAESW